MKLLNYIDEKGREEAVLFSSLGEDLGVLVYNFTGSLDEECTFIVECTYKLKCKIVFDVFSNP